MLMKYIILYLIFSILANSALAMIHSYDYNFYIILGEITGRQLCAKNSKEMSRDHDGFVRRVFGGLKRNPLPCW